MNLRASIFEEVYKITSGCCSSRQRKMDGLEKYIKLINTINLCQLSGAHVREHNVDYNEKKKSSKSCDIKVKLI